MCLKVSGSLSKKYSSVACSREIRDVTKYYYMTTTTTTTTTKKKKKEDDDDDDDDDEYIVISFQVIIQRFLAYYF